jgi:hypothetical protein
MLRRARYTIWLGVQDLSWTSKLKLGLQKAFVIQLARGVQGTPFG